ncbi:MAG: EscN/YscN/HrcN family type III secretion system ATPase, partial [Thiotrichaceae bacterium]
MPLKHIGESLGDAVDNCSPLVLNGRILQVAGTVVRAVMPQARIGELCLLRNRHDEQDIPAEVIGIDQKEVLLAPIGDMSGMSTSTQVIATGEMLEVPVGDDLLGCVLDGV